MNDNDLIEHFPISEERKKKIIEVTKSLDYRLLLINNLITTVNQTPTTELDSVRILSEAKAITRLLKISLETPLIKQK